MLQYCNSHPITSSPLAIPHNRQVIKRITLLQQKVVERIVEIPKIVEIQKVVEKIIPVEVEKIVEIPIIVEVPVEKQVEILRIVQIKSCCCNGKGEGHGDRQKIEGLMDELEAVKKSLEEMVRGCSEQVSFIRESKQIIELENEQLKNQVGELQQTINQLQLQVKEMNLLIIREQTMQISRSLAPSLELSDATLQENQFTIPTQMSQTPIFSKRVHTDQSLLEISMNQSTQSPPRQPVWRPFCTLKQFANGQNYDEGILLLLIIKLVQQIDSSLKKGIVTVQRPSTITIGYDNFGNVQVTLGDPIDINQPQNHPYLPPQTINTGQITQKSCVFNIGAVWDQLLHSTTYFRCTRDILNRANEYKVRDKGLNPLLASVINSMLCKTIKLRPTLKETLRLLKSSLMHLNKDSSSNAPQSDRAYE